MKKETEEKLAFALSAETTELLPFLPYLLQDLWELGSNPRDMTDLIEKHVPISENTKILDLTCGKGAVSVKIAKSLNVQVFGYDLIPEFIKYADKKAKETGVDSLCRFKCADANEAVTSEKEYDCVILGGSGNILGETWQECLSKMKGTIKPGGYILIDESYLSDGSSHESLKYKDEQLTYKQWLRVFQDSGLKLVEEVPNTEHDLDSETQAITARANELIEQYPEKRSIFEGYVQSQLNQCDDLDNRLVCVTWLLQLL